MTVCDPAAPYLASVQTVEAFFAPQTPLLTDTHIYAALICVVLAVLLLTYTTRYRRVGMLCAITLLLISSGWYVYTGFEVVEHRCEQTPISQEQIQQQLQTNQNLSVEIHETPLNTQFTNNVTCNNCTQINIQENEIRANTPTQVHLQLQNNTLEVTQQTHANN